MTEIQVKLRVSGIKSKDFIRFCCEKDSDTGPFVRIKNTLMNLNFNRKKAPKFYPGAIY